MSLEQQGEKDISEEYRVLPLSPLRNRLEGSLRDATVLSDILARTITSELSEIDAIKPILTTKREELGLVEEKLRVYVAAAEAAGINKPQEPREEGVYLDDFRRAWMDAAQDYTQRSTEIIYLQARVDQEPLLSAIKTILDYQGMTLHNLREIWEQEPDELITIARSLKKEIEIAPDDEFRDIKSSIYNLLLQEGPQVKAHLRLALVKLGYKADRVDNVFEQILIENGAIETGWCNDVGRATEQKHHAGGNLFKLPDQKLPERVIFYKGKRKDEINSLMYKEVLEFISGLPEPLPVKVISERYNQTAHYKIREQRLAHILWALTSDDFIDGTRAGRNTLMYGPKSKEVENSDKHVSPQTTAHDKQAMLLDPGPFSHDA